MRVLDQRNSYIKLCSAKDISVKIFLLWSQAIALPVSEGKEALEIIKMDLVHLGKANADLSGG